MTDKRKTLLIFLATLMLILPICGAVSFAAGYSYHLSSAQAKESAAQIQLPKRVTASQDQVSLLPAMTNSTEQNLEDIYRQVNPSVVNILVSIPQTATMQQFPNFTPFTGPNGSNPQIPDYSYGLGSGFVWDTQGHIVTNNHVIDGAEKVRVTFSDGTMVYATVVSKDLYSDLAVIKVDMPADQLHPVKMGDSSQVQVGQTAIAIGSPFGNQGTMTVGIISAVGRSLPVEASQQTSTTTASYTIPDVIQTDAPINPGNSGGVLLNELGEVIGVTSAIDSPVRASVGIGYAIPAAIVQRIIPALITDGKYDYPYLGISGTSLNPDLAQAMGLDADQRGALVETIVKDGPAAQAGLHPSEGTTSIEGQQISIGGDVITAINGHTIQGIDDLIAYLVSSTSVHEKVELTILRDGKETTVQVTLTARPAKNG